MYAFMSHMSKMSNSAPWLAFLAKILSLEVGGIIFAEGNTYAHIKHIEKRQKERKKEGMIVEG